MSFQDYLYLSILATGIISAAILLSELRRHDKKLPESWQQATHSSNFSLSILFLMIYLIVTFISESVSIYLATHGIYNHFIACIGYTLSIPFLFGFFFIYTQTKWKRYTYLIIYAFLIIHLTSGGYYYPDSVMPLGTILLVTSVHFIGALLHLTDLLLNPKSAFFRFQLQINLCILIQQLLSTILASFSISSIGETSDLIYFMHFLNLAVFHLLFVFVIIHKILKLRRLLH